MLVSDLAKAAAACRIPIAPAVAVLVAMSNRDGQPTQAP